MKMEAISHQGERRDATSNQVGWKSESAYRIVETVGPDGFYNEWADSSNYYVDFDISTDRIYKATGDDNENGMDRVLMYLSVCV